jgi:hypothetical protein
MDTSIKEEKVAKVKEKKKRKKSGWEAFVQFLSYGGFLLIIAALVGIFILISVVFKIKF